MIGPCAIFPAYIQTLMTAEVCLSETRSLTLDTKQRCVCCSRTIKVEHESGGRWPGNTRREGCQSADRNNFLLLDPNSSSFSSPTKYGGDVLNETASEFRLLVAAAAVRGQQRPVFRLLLLLCLCVSRSLSFSQSVQGASCRCRCRLNYKARTRKKHM
jgi:hypothetical protein